MDDRLYLAVYDRQRMKRCIPAIIKEHYICEIVLPGYEACQIQAAAAEGGRIRSLKGICRSRFAETPASLYELDESILPMLDQEMAPELVRHQAMAADDERLYNVYVYVSEAV